MHLHSEMPRRRCAHCRIHLKGGGAPNPRIVSQFGHVAIATDIAFALAALGVVGRRAPAELRTFLLTLDVVDDLATIAVIAIFFSKGLSLICLYGGAVVDRCA